jgi:hypothetical protein
MYVSFPCHIESSRTSQVCHRLENLLTSLPELRETPRAAKYEGYFNSK